MDGRVILIALASEALFGLKQASERAGSGTKSIVRNVSFIHISHAQSLALWLKKHHVSPKAVFLPVECNVLEIVGFWLGKKKDLFYSQHQQKRQKKNKSPDCLLKVLAIFHRPLLIIH